MAATNVQAFSGDVKVANTLTVSDNIVVDDGVYHPLTIDPTNSMIYNKSLYFPNIGADTYNYLGRFRIYAPPAIFNIWDSGTALGAGSRYSMSKAWGSTQAPVMNALEGSEFSTYNFYWEPEAAGEANEESVFYHVWFSPSRAGDYTFYIHAKEYQFPTEPSSPTYNDVIYGLLNLADNTGTQSHVVVGRPSVSGAATLQLHNESQTTGDRLTHEAIQLFSNTTPATGDVSNVFITMTPSTSNGGYGGYIEGWIQSGTNSGLSLGNISQGTKYRGLTITSQGSVGIGTNNPKTDLAVAGNFLSQDVASTSFSHNLYFDTGWKYASDSHGGALIRINNSQMEFWNAPTGGSADAAATMRQRMTIQQDGDVGIGAASPQEKLDVNGDVFFGAINSLRTGTVACHVQRYVSGLNVAELSDTVRVNGERRPGFVKIHYLASSYFPAGLPQATYAMWGFQWYGGTELPTYQIVKHQKAATTISLTATSNGTLTLTVSSTGSSYSILYTEWFYETGIYTTV